MSTVIPPPTLRPTCVRVSWLADHPTDARVMQYRNGSTGNWCPAVEAIDMIDPGWPVEVRLTPTEGAA